MSNNNSYILSEDANLTIFADGQVHTVDYTHPKFDAILDALKTLDFDGAVELIDIASAVTEFGEGKVTVEHGMVHYAGWVVDNVISSRIIRMMSEGFDVTPMVNFLDNLMQNPSMRAIKEAYRFLESNDLPITTDGCFLAYKNVSDNYMDKHSGTFRNMVGDTCSMPRSQVMDDPNQTCSAGLHVCSMTYLTNMWGHKGHTMVVKVNPRDLVSCPVDYENSKLRVCEYTVIAEHEHGNKDTLSEKAVYGDSDVGYKTAFESGIAAGIGDDGGVYDSISAWEVYVNNGWITDDLDDRDAFIEGYNIGYWG